LLFDDKKLKEKEGKVKSELKKKKEEESMYEQFNKLNRIEINKEYR